MNETERDRRQNRWRRSWVSAGVLFLGACGAGGPGADGEGVVTVSPDAMHSLPAPDVVARVVDLQPTTDGRVWVLNSTAPYFVVLGPNGLVQRQFGREGGGPEEFGSPIALVRGADRAEVWTYDVRRNALIRISTGERRELALPRDSIPPSSLISFQGAGVNAAAPWLESTSDGFLLARVRRASWRPESALQLWSADVVLLREDGPEVGLDLHTPIADFLGDPASRYGGATVLLPYPLWTVCADGTVGLYDPLANTLRRFTEKREELGVVALPDERQVQITEDRVFEMFYRQLQEDVPSSQIPEKEEMRQLTKQQNRQIVSNSAKAFPEYADLRCTPDGTLWLQPFDVTTARLGRGSDWLRFSADGSHTLVAFPREFRTFRIERDRIWGTVQDELGFESIVWVELDSLR